MRSAAPGANAFALSGDVGLVAPRVDRHGQVPQRAARALPSAHLELCEEVALGLDRDGRCHLPPAIIRALFAREVDALLHPGRSTQGEAPLDTDLLTLLEGEADLVEGE